MTTQLVRSAPSTIAVECAAECQQVFLQNPHNPATWSQEVAVIIQRAMESARAQAADGVDTIHPDDVETIVKSFHEKPEPNAKMVEAHRNAKTMFAPQPAGAPVNTTQHAVSVVDVADFIDGIDAWVRAWPKVYYEWLASDARKQCIAALTQPVNTGPSAPCGLRVALEFYAKKENHDYPDTMRDSPVHSDSGAKARAALAAPVEANTAEGWRPLTEADKVAKLMLLAWPNSNGGFVKAMGYWVAKFSEEANGDMEAEQCDADEHGTLFWPEGWYSCYNFDDDTLLRCYPTLCAVIPPLPAALNAPESRGHE